MAVVGKIGSGKSSLLSAILGIKYYCIERQEKIGKVRLFYGC